MSYVYDYYSNKKAIATQKSYPYTAKQASCKDGQVKGKVKTAGRSRTIQPKTAADWEKLLESGPVSIAVAAGNNYFSQYKSGILRTDACPKSIDHAVNMVGWGEEGGSRYWIIRNSWSTRWGEDGYIRIA